ncbi:hypothetical protein [Photorhabdus luminescens]|uniref:hypothetical protein n=1 Tax=Photorhabdus luminescens TaxID=29488 RepID=UPI00223E912A|nr:hypothetical protein [Photorhabdus luminescens]MCW7764151.1 hypothetical protein [Photorhabdus luminescens subsp. venezuelensis]
MSEESQRIKKPSSGYATDHFYDGAWHRAVKFVEGSVEFFDVYDVIFEGITYQSPPILVSENLIIVPIAKDEVAWNSKIEIYGAIGSGESEKIFSDGDATRPFAGELDVSNPQEPLVIFGGGNVSRFSNYTASVNGVEYGGLITDPERNSISLLRPIEDGKLMVFGKTETGKNVIVFEIETEGENKPLNGWVEFHDVATCILFRSGDLTGFANSYELRYEGTSTRSYRGLSPTHIRYENIGHHIRTEVELWAYWQDKPDGVLLFKGRYNGSAVKSSKRCSLDGKK